MSSRSISFSLSIMDQRSRDISIRTQVRKVTWDGIRRRCINKVPFSNFNIKHAEDAIGLDPVLVLLKADNNINRAFCCSNCFGSRPSSSSAHVVSGKHLDSLDDRGQGQGGGTTKRLGRTANLRLVDKPARVSCKISRRPSDDLFVDGHVKLPQLLGFVHDRPRGQGIYFLENTRAEGNEGRDSKQLVQLCTMVFFSCLYWVLGQRVSCRIPCRSNDGLQVDLDV